MSDFPAIGHVAVTVKDLAVSRPWYRLSSMRTDDLEARFPGLIGAILAAESNGTDKLMR